MLINSLPYDFDNLCFIGDFPKSTVQAMATVKANNKVLCNLNAGLDIEGVKLKPFPVVGAIDSAYEYQSANLKGFSSLKMPANIKQLLPGIVFDKKPLETQQLSELIEQLAIQKDSANLAVLNLNGAELEYLVEDDTLLNTFNCVIISCSSANIFSGSENSFNELLAHLKANSIAYSIFPAEVHPFSFVLVHRIPSWKASAEEIEIINTKFKENQIELSKALEQFDKLKSELENSNRERNRLNNELSSRRELVAKIEQAYKDEKKELESEVDRQKQWHLENKSWAESLKATNDKLSEKLNALENKIITSDDERNQLMQKIAMLEKEKQHAEQSLESNQKFADLNARLLTKANADLDDLRLQLKEKNNQVEELTSLITRLHAKLEQAAYYYEKLQQQNPDLGLESL